MNTLRTVVALLALISLCLSGCQKKCKPGEDVDCWMEALKDPEQREKAVGEIKALNDQKAQPALIEAFNAATDQPKMREEIAEVFNKWSTKEAVDPMLKAIDLSIGPDKDGKKAKATNRANQKIASALATIGDKKASGHMVRLMKATKNLNVKRAAIRAIGKLKATEAIEDLLGILNDKNAHHIIRANAVYALGDIGDPKLVPDLVKALYRDKALFFGHANLALVKIGQPAIDPLIDTMNGKNKEVKAMLEGNVEILSGALEANAAQVLGDIGDPKAIDPLLEMMAKVSKWESDNKLLVMVRLVTALGDIGDSKAVKPILGYLDPKYWDVRTVVANALTFIGDRSVVKELILYVHKTEQHPRARVPLIEAIGNLGTDEALPALMDMKEKYKDVSLAPAIKNSIKRLEAYKACKQNLDCWTGKLEDTDPVVREKAAYEIGQLGDEKAVDALVAKIGDGNELVRWGVIFALNKINSKKPIAAIEDLVNDKEKSSTRFRNVNNKYRRLIAKLNRTAK